MVVHSEGCEAVLKQRVDALETNHLLRDFINLPKPRMQQFLDQHSLPKSGTKAQLRDRVGDALDAGAISLDTLVNFLDLVIPWGKQHVYLLRGPDFPMGEWKDPDWVARHLSSHGVGDVLNRKRTLRFPEAMQISGIDCSDHHVRVTAVCRYDWFERAPEYDQHIPVTEQPELQFRAYSERVSRGLVCFEWDLLANTAFLQIPQLPPGIDCERIKEEFFGLIMPWLNPQLFSIVDLRPAIQRIHEQEEHGVREARSHGINYRTLEGKQLSGRSANFADSLLGDSRVDAALRTIRSVGVGQLGNFYWLPTRSPDGVALDREMHVILMGGVNRIHIASFDTEHSVRYVLSRIRECCTSAS